MNVLIVGFSKDKKRGGGGAVAMNRLSELLKKKNIQNKIITKEDFGTAEDNDFFTTPTKLPDFKITLYSKTNLSAVVEQENPDLVILNSLEVNSWSIFDLIGIKKPIIWISHDNFLHTGGCLYIFENTKHECKKYITACGACPLIESKYEHDISTLQFNIKQKMYHLMPQIQFLTPSNWLKEKMQESALLKERDIRVIPNAIDTKIFQVQEKIYARKKLDLPTDKKIILFAGTGIYFPHKGFVLFHAAIKLLNFNAEEVYFVSIGHNLEDMHKIGIYTIHHLGFIDNETKQALIYAAADIVVVPSWVESFGFTAAEALACGTPVVAFETSGLRDIIDHKKNGYLAKCFDAEDLKQGMEWVLTHPNYPELCRQAHQKVKQEFSYEVIGEKYKILFNQVIEKHQSVEYPQEVLNEIKALKEMSYSVLNLIKDRIQYHQNIQMSANIPNIWSYFGQLNAQDKIIFLLKKTKNKIKNDGLVLTSKNILKYSKYVAKKIFKI